MSRGFVENNDCGCVKPLLRAEEHTWEISLEVKPRDGQAPQGPTFEITHCTDLMWKYKNQKHRVSTFHLIDHDHIDVVFGKSTKVQDPLFRRILNSGRCLIDIWNPSLIDIVVVHPFMPMSQIVKQQELGIDYWTKIQDKEEEDRLQSQVNTYLHVEGSSSQQEGSMSLGDATIGTAGSPPSLLTQAPTVESSPSSLDWMPEPSRQMEDHGKIDNEPQLTKPKPENIGAAIFQNFRQEPEVFKVP